MGSTKFRTLTVFCSVAPKCDSTFGLFILFILANGVFGVKSVKILLIKLFLSFTKNISESLEVNYLALTKEFYNIAYVGIIGEPQDVVIGNSSLLLCRKVFCKV